MMEVWVKPQPEHKPRLKRSETPPNITEIICPESNPQMGTDTL